MFVASDSLHVSTGGHQNILYNINGCFLVATRAEGYGDIWNDKIVPGMKQAILCTLLCTQDQVEHRKVGNSLLSAPYVAG